LPQTNTASWLLKHWLHGLSPQVEASIDGWLILDHQVIEKPPQGGRLRAAFFFGFFGAFRFRRGADTLP
jgi:hypothetical protein